MAKKKAPRSSSKMPKTGAAYIYINNSFVSFRLFLYSYDLLDLCNVLFLMNFDLIMLFISLILPYGRCIIVLCKVTKIVSSSVSFPHT